MAGGVRLKADLLVCDLLKLRERVVMKFVWSLPRWLTYWSAIRLWAHATTGQYGDTEPDALRFSEALSRWEQQP